MDRAKEESAADVARTRGPEAGSPYPPAPTPTQGLRTLVREGTLEHLKFQRTRMMDHLAELDRLIVDVERNPGLLDQLQTLRRYA